MHLSALPYAGREVVAMAVLAKAVRGLGVPVSRFSSLAQHLFDMIADQLQSVAPCLSNRMGCPAQLERARGASAS